MSTATKQHTAIHPVQLIKREPYFASKYGAAYLGDSLDFLGALPARKVNLVVTSPPLAPQSVATIRTVWFPGDKLAEAVNILPLVRLAGSSVIVAVGPFTVTLPGSLMVPLNRTGNDPLPLLLVNWLKLL